MKKKLQHLEEETAIMKLYHQITDKKEEEAQKPNEEVVLRKMI